MLTCTGSRCASRHCLFLDSKFVSLEASHTFVFEKKITKNVKCSHARNFPLKFQIAQHSCGCLPTAADELSTANFSVCACQCEEKEFLNCSQNMSYPFESSVNTEQARESLVVSRVSGMTTSKQVR